MIGAQFTSMLYNLNRGKSPARPITDFMIVARSLEEQHKSTMDAEQRELQHMQMFILGMGGRV